MEENVLNKQAIFNVNPGVLGSPIVYKALCFFKCEWLEDQRWNNLSKLTELLSSEGKIQAQFSCC